MHSNFNDLKNENMTAKEWLFENYPQVKDEWNKTGHDDNYMVRMMEEYHQAKLKLLGIGDVVGRSEQLKAFLDYVDGRYSEQGTRDKIVDEFLSL